MSLKIFIFGYFGWHNVGDDAIGYSILKELSERYPSAEFVITAEYPYYSLSTIEDISKKNKVSTIRFDIFSILKEIKRSKIFIMAGGTHFHDEDEYMLRRVRLLLSFFLMTSYAKVINRSPVLLGHGIGPIFRPWSRFFVRLILKNAKIIAVRDKESYEVASSMGCREKCILGFDCTAILLETITHMKMTNDDKSKTIGMSILPKYSIYSKNNRDQELIFKVANCIKEILDQSPEVKIKLFAFRSGIRHSDDQIILELCKKLKEYDDRIKTISYDGHIINFLSEMHSCDMFVGMRYHSSLFAYLLDKPTIIIDYMGKCRSLAKYINVPEDTMISIDNMEDLILKKMVDSPNSYIAKLDKEDAYAIAKNMFSSICT